mmetsp:Transcript_14348/g.23702  ORF Transcript_14348/g.23702 Transcript_14348/m.23702 type:complete len:128 (-) Transcript_14348:114-497(-)
MKLNNGVLQGGGRGIIIVVALLLGLFILPIILPDAAVTTAICLAAVLVFYCYAFRFVYRRRRMTPEDHLQEVREVQALMDSPPEYITLGQAFLMARARVFPNLAADLEARHKASPILPTNRMKEGEV